MDFDIFKRNSFRGLLVDRWVKASMETRQNMMKNPYAASIAAMVVCSNREIQVISHPIYCALDDTIVGVVESGINLPVSIEVDCIIRNTVLVLVGASSDHLVTSAVGDGPHRVCWLPMAFPVMKGHGILTGDIFDTKVQVSLQKYHSTLGKWSDLMLNEMLIDSLATIPEIPAYQRPDIWVALGGTEQNPPLSSTSMYVEMNALAPSKIPLVMSVPVEASISTTVVNKPKEVVDEKFDVNSYANYKSVAQGLLNGSVFSVNIGILVNVYGKYNNDEEISFFTPLVTFLILSLWIEFFNMLFALILLVFYDIKRDEHKPMSKLITFAAVLLSFFSLFINIVVANFISQSGVTLIGNSTSPGESNSTMGNSTLN